MKYTDFFESDAKLRSEDEIKEFIKNSKHFEAGLENPAESNTLLLFQTSKQKTWLVITDTRLYCILDDARYKKPTVAWSKSKSQLARAGSEALEINVQEKSENTGYVDIGPKHKKWLFTKSLFKEQDVKASIEELIVKKML